MDLSGFHPAYGLCPLCVGAPLAADPWAGGPVPAAPTQTPAGSSWGRIRASASLGLQFRDQFARPTAQFSDWFAFWEGRGEPGGALPGEAGLWAPRLCLQMAQSTTAWTLGRCGFKPHSKLWGLEQVLNLSVPYLFPGCGCDHRSYPRGDCM